MIAQEQDPGVRSLAAATFVLADPKWNVVDAARLLTALRRLRELLLSLPETTRTLRVIEGDARQIPAEDASVDFVLTSPPYINVFNYHQQYRPAVEALGHDVLEAARSEIGSNRKHRMNRFLTVIQYSIDIVAAVSELKRVVRADGRMIFIVGRESKVRGLPIYNGDLVCRLATRVAGLNIITRQERAFMNRFGERIVEDILHFTGDASKPMVDLSLARQVGREYLEDLRTKANGEVRADIEAAIAFAADVLPSPIFADKSPITG